MPEPLPDWPRPKFQSGGGTPFVFFVVFGEIGELPSLSAAKYRVGAIPPDIEIVSYTAAEQLETLDNFRTGFDYVWRHLQAKSSELARQIAAAQECYVIRGPYEDRADLNDFRDVIGFTTFVLDQRGVGILDVLQLRWWSPDDWREHIFAPAAPVPQRHVVTLTSADDDNGGTWYHTRGLLKFGRPELSCHGVPPELHKNIVELFHRLIDHLAAGGIVKNRQNIRMPGIPTAYTCTLQGDHDDPDFNNFHLEIAPA